MSKETFVKFYDIKTDVVTSIPASELSSGMVRMRFAGSQEVYWVNASEMTVAEGQYWHPPFSGELKERIVFIQKELSDVHFKTLEDWEEGFRQDLQARDEISQWFRVSMLYSMCAGSNRLTREQKHEAFAVLGACLNGTRNTVFHIAKVTTLPMNIAERLADDYFSYQ